MMIRCTILFSLAILASCATYDVNAIRTAQYTPDDSYRKVGIGFFEMGGSGTSQRTQRDFWDALAFQLQQKGYQVSDATATRESLVRTDLPADRALSPNEVLQFSGKFLGRVLLQGRIQEVKTERLVETRIQAMVHVQVYDTTTGKKLGEIILFARDLEYNTARETMTMARHITDKLDDLLLRKK